MAVNSEVVSAGLKLMVQTGLDSEGSPIIKTRTFSRLKPTATDEAIYNTGDNLGSLQEHSVSAIRKVTETDLISE